MSEDLYAMDKRIQERMETMKGVFTILSVERKQKIFFKCLEITAQDKDSQFIVTVHLEGNPDQERIINALKYELQRAFRRDALARMQGKSIAY